LGEKHPILAGAALSASDQVVDFLNQCPQKRLMLRSKAMTQRGKRDVFRFAQGHSGLADEFVEAGQNLSES